MDKILPIETQTDEADKPDNIGEVKISKTEWNATELAFVLGLRKKFDDNTGKIEYGVTETNLLTTLISQMILSHERFKRERIGLKDVGGGLNLPGHPFIPGNGNGG